MGTEPDDPETAAVEQLEELGLSTYAARTFVALVRLGSGTARDVSRVADVPRTRVYGAADELVDRGLVDVQQSSPREFWAVSASTAGSRFEQEFHHRTAVLTTALSELEPVQRTEQSGVWTVTGEAAVEDRVVAFIDDADDEVVYMTVEDLLTDDVVAALGDAADRGVDIHLGGVSPAVQEELAEVIPDAELFESLWLWSDTPAARLVMVDGERTLVSVFSNGATAGDGVSETAIWGDGERNSLVVVLKAIFTWRLEDH